MHFLIINGPNLNLLGKREPEIYGKISFEEYLVELRKNYPEHQIDYFQSNHEGALIDKIQETGFSVDGIIINPGAYSHTSIAIADALKAVTSPAVEVHISNIYDREAFRQHSYIKSVSVISIVGKGLKGYEDALNHLLEIKRNQRS